jgi:hypothetical protein
MAQAIAVVITRILTPAQQEIKMKANTKYIILKIVIVLVASIIMLFASMFNMLSKEQIATLLNENAIDPDGRKILFVNGHYQDNWVGRNIVRSDKGGVAYWDGTFASSAQGFFKDYSNISSSNYIDGSSSWGGDMSGQDRYEAGMAYAKANLKVLTADMVEGETFKMVTHSEGSAYGACVAQYLIDQGYKVETVVHLSADEGDEFSTPTALMTYQLGYDGDWVTGNKNIKGVDKSGLVNSGLSWDLVHGSTKNGSVFQQVQDLTTVRTRDNIGMVNGKFAAWRS